MGFFDDAISSIGQGLATTAVQSISQATGVDVGGTLGFLFGGGQTTGGQNLDNINATIQGAFGPDGTSPDTEALNQLTATVDQQQQAITALGTQLTGISTELANIKGEIDDIEQLLKKIGQDVLFIAWNEVNVTMSTYIDSINAAYAQYGTYVSGFADIPTELVTSLSNEIIDPTVGPSAGISVINNLLLGDGGQSKGALQLWSEMVQPLVQNGTIDYRLAVQQYFQYYQKLVYAQLQATNLVMEAYTFLDIKTIADETWKKYNKQLLEQEDTFINWLVPLVYSGEIGGVIPWPQAPYVTNFSLYDAATQLNPGVQYVRGNKADPGKAFYSPSSIFQAAEQLLATLYVTSESARRIVVHMLYPSGLGASSILAGLDLTLDAASSSDTPIQAVSSTVLGGPYPFPGPQSGASSNLYPDWNVYTSEAFYLKRYVYDDSAKSGLASADTYNLSNMNGVNGLVGMETYSSHGHASTPFQQQSVIDYSMPINNVSKFNFMNFAAYTVPQLDLNW